MSIKVEAGTIYLSGDCGAEEAETLIAALMEPDEKLVELSQVKHLHAIIVQVLLSLKPSLRGMSGDNFVGSWLIPSMRAAVGTAADNSWSIPEVMMPTILIVDDSKLARIVAGKAINALQPTWQRVEAGNADEAMLILGQQHIDVVLLDFNMPGRNGVELAHELRRSRPTMPIAIITANIQHEVVESAKAANATFVGKPVTPEGLRQFLAEAADGLNDTRL